MCFGNKKKRTTSRAASSKRKSKIVGASNASGLGENLKRSEASLRSGRSLSKSVLKEENVQLSKSSVRLKEIRDPDDMILFPNCRTEKIQISAIMN